MRIPLSLPAGEGIDEDRNNRHESPRIFKHDCGGWRRDGPWVLGALGAVCFREPRAVVLHKKVTLRSDPSLSGPGREAYGVKMEVQLRNGSVLEAELAAPPGRLEN